MYRSLLLAPLLLLVPLRAFAQAPPETPPPPAEPAPAEPAPAEPAPPTDQTQAPQEQPKVVQMEDTTGAPSPVAQPQAVVEPQPGTGPTGTPPVTRGGPEPAEGSDEWRFQFHGYLRAPMRVGVGRRDNPAAGQSATTYHAPIIPDDQYLSWQHTMHNQKDWAEMFFSYGNSFAKGTVALQAFNFTDAAWKEDAAQFGISQGWVEITPDLPYENVRMWWKVGSFWNRYGTAGRYDAGQYDTFLFGRTHAMGETIRGEIDVGDITIGAEHGIGAKRPNPSVFNRARFTLLHHMHADLKYDDLVTFGLHHLYSWAQEESRFGDAEIGAPPAGAQQPDGSLAVYGAEVRLDANMFGYLYLGYSHIAADDAVTVAPAIEVLHSYGGGEFTLGVTDNYLDSVGCTAVVAGTPPAANRCSGGNGGVNSVLGQYEFSFANLMKNLEEPGSKFWGDGQDVKLILYGMFNAVSSSDPVMDGVTKLKYGTDLSVIFLPWMGAAVRFDRVQPNSEIAAQSFSILSPRLIFKSAFVTHEEIQLQYSRYFYNQRTCAAGGSPADCVQSASAPVLPDGFGATDLNQDPNTRGAPTTDEQRNAADPAVAQRPDLNVFKIQASMWW